MKWQSNQSLNMAQSAPGECTSFCMTYHKRSSHLLVLGNIHGFPALVVNGLTPEPTVSVPTCQERSHLYVPSTHYRYTASVSSYRCTSDQ